MRLVGADPGARWDGAGAVVTVADGAPGWLALGSAALQTSFGEKARIGAGAIPVRTEVFSESSSLRSQLLPEFVTAQVVHDKERGADQLVGVSAEGKVRSYPLPIDESAKLRLTHAPPCLGVERMMPRFFKELRTAAPRPPQATRALPPGRRARRP